MNNKVYIFDVDGTLTPARQPATREFLSFFETWAKENTFYLCSGSDLEKIKEQLPESILNLASGVFACMGNAFYVFFLAPRVAEQLDHLEVELERPLLRVPPWLGEFRRLPMDLEQTIEV